MSAPGLRARGPARTINPSDPNETISERPKPLRSEDEDGPLSLSVLDVLRILGGLVLLSSALSYFVTGNSIVWNAPRPAWTRPARIKAWWVR